MKKILLIGLIFGLSFAVNINIRPGNTGGKVSNGLDYYNLEIIGQVAPTASALSWYGDGIAGCSSIMAIGADVSSGSAFTTINAQPYYANGVAVSTAAQTITVGTSFTAINAPFYLFSIPAFSVTRNVTLNFCIRN